MEMLSVGQVHESFIGMPEGMSTTLTESGIQVLITFVNPVEEEKEFIRTGETQIKLLTKNNVPFMFYKFGDLDWFESPIYIDEEQLENILDMKDDTVGYGMYIILADPVTGIIHGLRAVGIGHQFSKEYNSMLLRAPMLTKEEYINTVHKIQNTYRVKELVKMSNVSYKFGTKGV